MNLAYLLPPLISAGVAVSLALIVMAKGWRNRASRSFLLIAFGATLWGLFVFLMRASPDVEHALPWNKAAIGIAFAMFIFYYHFSLAITRAKKNRAAILGSYLLLALIFALSPTNILVQTMVVESYGYAPIFGSVFYLLMPAGFLLLGLAFYQLAKSYKASRDYQERNRLLYVILALILPVAGAIPEIFPIIYPTAIFGNIAFCLITSVAIFRYHLFDIRIVIRKGLAYLMISSLVAIPYVGVIILISRVLAPQQVPIWLHALLLLSLAFATQPLWRRVQRTVDRLFYRGRYDYLDSLEHFSRECTGIIELETLCSRLVSLTSAAMGTTRACLLMPHGSKKKFNLVASTTTDIEDDVMLDADSAIVRWLKRHDRPLWRSDLDFNPPLAAVTTKERNMLERIGADLLVPFKYGEKLNGVLILSPKLSEEPYGADDIATLMVLARHASTAIENAHLYAQSQQMAMIDELTGLYNRRHFYEMLDAEMSRTQRYGHSFSLVMLDLDGFKEYNDRFGHASGDAVLQSFTQTLKSTLRKSETAFRYGGDEFTIILPATDVDKAKKATERIRSKWLHVIEAHYPTPETPIGFSVGIAQFPEHAETADSLVFLADTALYYAKREGGYRATLVSELETISPDILSMATRDQVYALAATVDARDPCTYGHSKRVAEVAGMIGKAIGLSEKELADLYAAALLHDIGKIGVPDSILTKPGKLTDDEWEIIKKHSAEGARIVGYVKELRALVPVIQHHHEWYDGMGYPDGLKGEEIPVGARIISVADAYDTMTTERPYNDVISQEEAFEEFRRWSGTQFDPESVEALWQAVNEANGQD